MGEPIDLDGIIASQLDADTCEEIPDVMLPVAVKRAKYMSQSAPCKDMTKWVQAESGPVPFVMNNQTQVVHSAMLERLSR